MGDWLRRAEMALFSEDGGSEGGGGEGDHAEGGVGAGGGDEGGGSEDGGLVSVEAGAQMERRGVAEMQRRGSSPRPENEERCAVLLRKLLDMVSNPQCNKSDPKVLNPKSWILSLVNLSLVNLEQSGRAEA